MGSDIILADRGSADVFCAERAGEYVLRHRRAVGGHRGRQPEDVHRICPLRTARGARAVHLYAVHRELVRIYTKHFPWLRNACDRSDNAAGSAADTACRDVRHIGDDRAARDRLSTVDRPQHIR